MSALPASMRGGPRAHGLEVLFEAVLGLAAVSGGLTLMARPDGSALGASLPMLARSPFSSFFVPGLLLAAVVGGLNLVAAALTLRHSALARGASLAAGLATLGFIAVEVTMIPFSPLQLIIAAMGITIALLAFPQKSR